MHPILSEAEVRDLHQKAWAGRYQDWSEYLQRAEVLRLADSHLELLHKYSFSQDVVHDLYAQLAEARAIITHREEAISDLKCGIISVP